MQYRKVFASLSRFLLAAALCFTPTLAATSPPVVMKLLVLSSSSDDISYQSITTYLNQIGVPYNGVLLNSRTPNASGDRLSSLSLSDSANGRGLYQGIIVADRGLLSNADWSTLNTYALQY